MKARTLGILVILAASFVAVVVLTSDREDASLVQELKRELEQNSVPVYVEETNPEPRYEFWQLTDQLKSTKIGDHDTWLVISENKGAMIRLPFLPTRGGHFPAAAAMDQSLSSHSPR
jgi:hypothetical protein